MAFSTPKAVLNQLLKAYNTHKETLTESEIELAKRIRCCDICKHLFVQRKKTIPKRCPSCWSRNWNRPSLNLYQQNFDQIREAREKALDDQERAKAAEAYKKGQADERTEQD